MTSLGFNLTRGGGGGKGGGRGPDELRMGCDQKESQESQDASSCQ